VVFLLTTGNVLDDTQRESLRKYVESGGGFLGVHSAADSEYDSPWYGQLLGARFRTHPAIQQARVQVEDGAHPATAHFPASFQRTDEWYDFDRTPRGDVHVLLSLDERSYADGSMNDDHPISWCNGVGLGRMFYTGMGHTKESYAEPAFRDHLRGALQYVAGRREGDCLSRNGNGAGLRREANGEAVTDSNLAFSPADLSVVRWRGSILPRFNEPFRITFAGDGDVRMLIDGREVAAGTVSPQQPLVRDVTFSERGRSAIAVEYRPRTTDVPFEVRWNSAHQSDEIVAAPQLYEPRTRPTRR
jgi:type 1 glutamine amidotransferase